MLAAYKEKKKYIISDVCSLHNIQVLLRAITSILSQVF